MNIQKMFAKPIDRSIKGVIKVGQDDNENIRQELEEYVVTRELPSITRFGMAALLPHRELELKSDGTALVDGSPCIDLKQREAILLKHQENARCVQYDDIKNMKVAELREIFAGQNVVYVYHN